HSARPAGRGRSPPFCCFGEASGRRSVRCDVSTEGKPAHRLAPLSSTARTSPGVLGTAERRGVCQSPKRLSNRGLRFARSARPFAALAHAGETPAGSVPPFDPSGDPRPMRQLLLAGTGATLLIAGACASAPTPQTAGAAPKVAAAPAPVTPPPPDNPLLAPSTAPPGATPPPDRVHVEQFKPTLDTAAAAQRQRTARRGATP